MWWALIRAHDFMLITAERKEPGRDNIKCQSWILALQVGGSKLPVCVFLWLSSMSSLSHFNYFLSFCDEKFGMMKTDVDGDEEDIVMVALGLKW